ncbi:MULTISPECIES: hypothetical protein [Tsukamurella]|uniref:Lipoprotein n=2 Tax=Tsukamurella TaxID=2060 RepID=A0A3P8ME63_TSUPA|nr:MULTISPECIES: hypothetical protein [Tsukamurella]NKY18171.1 hypothetical protein [Tsukamurella spumae]UEA84026.1 hypothetical protein LK411_04090 [Tsukamurella paurometabola]VDR41186.1 Uncharacterised protein [Tsukamurella paurometabola]
MNTKNITIAVLTAGMAAALTGCGDGTASDTGATSTAPVPAAASEGAPNKNARGAIEAEWGQPVEVKDASGKRIVKITPLKLDATGCDSISASKLAGSEGPTDVIVNAVRFVAKVETGDYKSSQWLWQSNIDLIANNGQVVTNLDLSQDPALSDIECHGAMNPQLIGVPTNSSKVGGPNIYLPIGKTNGGPKAIGYAVMADGVPEGTYRVEWTRPADGWQLIK